MKGNLPLLINYTIYSKEQSDIGNKQGGEGGKSTFSLLCTRVAKRLIMTDTL